MEPHLYMVIEIIICFILSFILVFYYTRRGTNPLALLTAAITWSLNFILIIFIPYDIYYAYSGKKDENIKTLLIFGYQLSYWILFFCSWIFIPLMQEYEDSGDFTKKKKFIRSIKNNLIFYLILGLISLALLVAGFFVWKKIEGNQGVNVFILFLYELANFSYFIGLLLYYFLFAYSITTLPKKIYYKIDYNYQVKYLEWRAIDLKNKLEKIKKDLVDDGYLLQSTLEYFQIKKRVNKSMIIEEDQIINEDESSNVSEKNVFSSSILTDYAPVIKERYDYLYDNAKVFDIVLKKNTVDNDKEPLKSVEELIKLNRKINKNEWDDLRIQIRIRNLYKHWITYSTVLMELDIPNESNIEIVSNIKNEELIQGEKENVDYHRENIEQEFIPLKNMSNLKKWYYIYLNRPLSYVYLALVVSGSILALVSQIGSMFNASLYGKIVKAVIEGDLGIVGLHFFIMIPIIFLFVMSIYTFFKLNISGYFYMYKNRQTDSVSLMYFSTNLCRISFSICLSFILTIKSEFDKSDEIPITKIEEILGLVIKEKSDGFNPTEMYFKVFHFCPIILGFLVLILILRIPQRIAKICGKSIFQIESDESMNEIKEGHDYFMEINEKYKGELIPEEKLSLPKDKYN